MRFLLAALLSSAALFAQTCDYTIQPTTLTIPSSASTGLISVNTQSSCSWTVSNPNLPWLTFDIVQGTGSANIRYTALGNNTAVDRTGSISIAAKQIAVTQAATQCSYSIDPKSRSIGVSGGTGTFTVTSGCIWNVTSNNGNFIVVSDPNTIRTASAPVSYTVGANLCVAGRSGSITVNTTSPPALSPVFTIAQDGSPSNLTLSATSATVGPDASDGRITVTTGQGCGWTATSDVTWMQIINYTGNGNGAISYHLLANNTATRTGAIHVGNLTYTVTQTASGPVAPTVAAVTSAANYRADAISPGEIVTLFGDNMGPVPPVTLQVVGGSVTSFLAGTQVLFDSTPAPLIFTSKTQVSVVAPYNLAGKTSTNIQVVYNGVTSPAFNMPVQAAHPAIFTLDSSGLGPGAILNQDYNVNTGQNAAARGSVVAIYATGGGVTQPALSDGAVTGSTLPMLTQTVTVTIGGIDARVAYAGGAPGSVAGLTQINAEVPAGVTPGSAVSVVVKVGSFTSTAGVTLAVR